jgi:hypothetical protein
MIVKATTVAAWEAVDNLVRRELVAELFRIGKEKEGSALRGLPPQTSVNALASSAGLRREVCREVSNLLCRTEEDSQWEMTYEYVPKPPPNPFGGWIQADAELRRNDLEEERRIAWKKVVAKEGDRLMGDATSLVAPSYSEALGALAAAVRIHKIRSIRAAAAARSTKGWVLYR